MTTEWKSPGKVHGLRTVAQRLEEEDQLLPLRCLGTTRMGGAYHGGVGGAHSTYYFMGHGAGHGAWLRCLWVALQPFAETDCTSPLNPLPETD